MKFTLSWLKDHLDTSASLAEIVDTLTRVGLEVESVEDPARKYDGFAVASVIEAKQHPNADRLKVCIVDAGGGPVQVVCGAPNARTGMKSVFSPVGTYIPGKKLTLAKGVIRGVESNGMLCSAAELELSEDHDGIIELPDDAPVGSVFGMGHCADDITRAGWPFKFFEEGGFEYHSFFNPGTLMAYVGIGLVLSMIAGMVARRQPKRD